MEHKVHEFYTYQLLLAKIAVLSVIAAVFVLSFLIIAINLPLKLETSSHDDSGRLEHHSRDVLYDEHYEKFKKYMYKYDKRYENENELQLRFGTFRSTLRDIEKLEHLEKLTKTKFGINSFSDISDEEFGRMLMPKLKDQKTLRSRKNTFIQPMPPIEKIRRQRKFFNGTRIDTAAPPTPYVYPRHFDWRDSGVVTPVKAQNNCGSCWAFGAAATVESAYAIEHGELRSLSEQELLDCDLSNNACDGGDADKAFRFIHDSGLALESEYPYVAKRQNVCALVEHPMNTTKLDMVYFINPDENAIIEWLVSFGPVNIGINVPPSMKKYVGGVYRPSDYECLFNILGTHALNIVGYGTNEDGEKYWIVKNSWGQKWGIEDGYVLMARGVNACGIEDEPIGVLA